MLKHRKKRPAEDGISSGDLLTPRARPGPRLLPVTHPLLGTFSTTDGVTGAKQAGRGSKTPATRHQLLARGAESDP